ncbi:hypothetical protein ACOSP7_002307 [Xanthoceras sorbifolium]|uniref:Protein DMP7-like n=1 Tax=Xanthoceras sorbifolium TaxID=99658 RepID=A0ABQ8GZD5_9ROSI|nr:hypothetical protein JRO89_XSUnG0136000 [Xanthoceras sorbifolium]
MDIKIENDQVIRTSVQEQQQPLLENAATVTKPPKTPTQKAMRKTFKGTANLARLLPTGSVLTFQILSPILTHQGQCHTYTSHLMTLGLVALCALSCFLLRLTDSFRDERGKVRYGLATFRGLVVLDTSLRSLSQEEAAKYQLKFIDFFHAFTSLLVFGAVALFDKNVVKCFYPEPSEEAEDLLVILPVMIGLISSVLFVAFPSKRHGIGCPLSRD